MRCRALALLIVSQCLLACGSGSSTSDAGTGGPPQRFDAGMQADAGTTTTADAGDRFAACGSYCQKLFQCGFFPRPEHPAGYSVATCTDQCAALGGFPPEDTRQCVASASCVCDGGGCHDVPSCFPSAIDGGP